MVLPVNSSLLDPARQLLINGIRKAPRWVFLGNIHPDAASFPGSGRGSLETPAKRSVIWSWGQAHVCVFAPTCVLSQPRVRSSPCSGGDLNLGCLLARKLVGRR